VREIIFTPVARFELIEAEDWYENESPGLGRKFLVQVDAVVTQIISNPRLFPVVHKDVRRALLKRFPHALMFVIEQDEALTVISCFHGSRDPLRWQSRT
jgi:toxin ParE1/3/4